MSLPLLVPKPVPLGSESYEAKRKAIADSLAASIPSSLHLTQEQLTKSKNVTQIPRECGLLKAEELDITESYDAVGIAEAIASGKLTSRAVVSAFGKRAAIAHQLTSCLTEWFLDEALQRADELDKILQETGKTVGPFHGVPFSVKNYLPLTGHWSSPGFVDGTQKYTWDCHIVELLREAGAVFYCKTNQPQAIMHLESTSMFGRTLNPYNVDLSAGGSTGGEAALLALRGSVIGIGSDIGGSIRQPAAVCGIYGFKPTSHVFPWKNSLPGGSPAELNIDACSGPMCLSLRDMDYYMKVVLATKPWLKDPFLVPMQWTGLATKGEPKGEGRIKIGVMMHDGIIMPQPPITRALLWATQKLDAAGIQWKSFQPYKPGLAANVIRQAYWPDGGKFVRQLLETHGEPVLPLTETAFQGAKALDVYGIHAARQARNDYRRAFSLNWEEQDVDVVLCPAFVGPAPVHDTARHWNYTALWNYVDYPGAVFPTPLTVDASDAKEYQGFGTDECNDVKQLWKEGDFAEAPLSLQLVARRYHDNQLFEALEVIKEAFDLE